MVTGPASEDGFPSTEARFGAAVGIPPVADGAGEITAAATAAVGTGTGTATTYYVSPSGSDTNPGTFTQPFRTLARGTGVLKPGSILYVRGGTYAESLVDKIPSGTSWNAPVTVAAYAAETAIVQPTSGNFVVRIGGASSYIVLSGLVFDGSLVASANVYIAAGFLGTPHHIRITNSEVRNGPSQGILVESVAGYPKPDYNEFLKLRVHHNGTTDFHHGFYIQSNYNLIEGSDIYRNAGWGIQVFKQGGANGFDAGHNVIRNNKVHDNARAGARGVGIGVYVGAANLVYNNLIWGNVMGISVDYGASDTGIYNNVVYGNAGDAGIHLGSNSAHALIINNIVYKNTNGGIKDYGTNTVLASNLVGIDPRFVDEANYNFHLLAGSPAINAGTAIAEVTTDFDGVLRPRSGAYDIGAFEY
jgi:hypothetical protein